MTAVDTNIVVRILTNDDAAQTALARKIFESGQVWIGKTVLLETAWVLKFRYDFDDTAVLDAFVRLLGLDSVTVEDQKSVTRALGLMPGGIDFPDAIHLCSRPPGSQVVTMDGKFARRAKKAGDLSVRLLHYRM